MPSEIGREEMRRMVADGAQLLEVLPAEEYAEDHLPGAISIPLPHIDAESVKVLENDRAMTYTLTGIRSPSASRSATWTGEMVIDAGAFIVCRPPRW